MTDAVSITDLGPSLHELDAYVADVAIGTAQLLALILPQLPCPICPTQAERHHAVLVLDPLQELLFLLQK